VRGPVPYLRVSLLVNLWRVPPLGLRPLPDRVAAGLTPWTTDLHCGEDGDGSDGDGAVGEVDEVIYTPLVIVVPPAIAVTSDHGAAISVDGNTESNSANDNANVAREAMVRLDGDRWPLTRPLPLSARASTATGHLLVLFGHPFDQVA
jgi:hypothetical protein